MTISDTKLYQRSLEIISSEIDDETVMMDSNFEHYYGLEAIGTEVWKLLENPISISQMADHFTERYDVTKEQCIEDLSKLLADLQDNGMLAESA